MTQHRDYFAVDKDYYAILGVSPRADRAAIEAAYERLSRRFQPNPGEPPLDSERMLELNEAFDVLDDPLQRVAYDQSRGISKHRGARNVAGWLGVIGWLIVIAGLLMEGLLGVGVVLSCGEDTSGGLFDETSSCASNVAFGLGVGLALSLYFIIPALVFFACRHVLLLLTEIAEKE